MLLVSHLEGLCFDVMLNYAINKSFWFHVVTPHGQREALCNYLALPSNLFQLFQEHRDVISPLLQR